MGEEFNPTEISMPDYLQIRVTFYVSILWIQIIKR